MKDYLKKNIIIRNYIEEEKSLRDIYKRFPFFYELFSSKYGHPSADEVNKFFGEVVIEREAPLDMLSINYVLTLCEDNYPELFL